MNKTGHRMKYILSTIAIIAVFFVSLHLLRRNPADQPVMANTPWALHTSFAKQGAVTEVFPALGKVQSASDITLAPQISGTVLSLGPREGGRIKTGELLVKIDTSELVAQRDALKAQLTGAENAAKNAAAEYARQVKLKKNGWVAQSVIDAQETRKQTTAATVSALLNQIKTLSIKIAYGTITAPLDASVIKRAAEVGDTVFPGKPIYVLSAHGGGRVVVPLPLSALIKVYPSSPVELIDGDRVIKARVTRVNPSLDANAMGSLEIDLPDRPFNLPDGSPVSVNVVTSQVARSIIVAPDALTPSDDPVHRTVFRIRAGTPQTLVKTPVEVSLCGREGCAVTGKLSVGDQLARGHGSVLLRLRDGDAVSTGWKAGAGL